MPLKSGVSHFVMVSAKSKAGLTSQRLDKYQGRIWQVAGIVAIVTPEPRVVAARTRRKELFAKEKQLTHSGQIADISC
jgi:hypothetical protein